MEYKEYFTRKEFINMVEAYNKAEKERQELIAENARLKSCLQEIKAIAENYIKGCVDCSLIAEPYECKDCTDGGMAKLGKKILDLITKAEEE